MIWSPPAPLRQLARRALWSLAVGVACTLLLSWTVPQALLGFGLAQHTTWSQDAFWIDTTRGGHYQRSTLWCSDWIIMKRIIFTGTPESQPYFRHNIPPAWACTLDLAGLSGFEEVHTGATGWPCRAFASESWRRWTPRPDEEAEALRYNFVLASTPRGRIMFPLRPIWSGLAADVAVFGAGWFAIVVVAGGVRAVVRRARGRCPGCGYDRRGLPDAIAPCPECGLAPR
ncbi:hypothetical protein PHYC_01017 [Phycisphaerales bacterium]|nr:hypothetical protein PHYC_01017 [Phycisphaerales bacterium]